MAWLHLPSVWSHPFSRLCSHRGGHVRVSDLPTLHTLSETVGTTTVCLCCSNFLPMLELTEHLRSIIRVLFMVPIYAAVSFLSYFFYRHSVYYSVLRDCYEAFAIASFFALLCHYIAPDLHSQKDYFRGLKPRSWVIPLSWFKKCCGGERGIWRTPRSGLTWFNVRMPHRTHWDMLIFSTDHLVRRIPILPYSSLYDSRSAYHANRRKVLLGIFESCICAYLGQYLPMVHLRSLGLQLRRSW